MYTKLWNKYLSIIRILLKKAAINEQTLNLNASDFERAGFNRKSGYKFNIQFINGKADNIISSSALARDLTVTLLEDDVVKNLFIQNDYHINMNAKYQLSIKFIPKIVVQDQPSSTDEPVGAEETAS